MSRFIVVLVVCMWIPTFARSQHFRPAFAFRATPAPTLREAATSAKVILYGSLVNPAMNPAGDKKNAVTDLNILKVLKSDSALKNNKVITLSLYIPVPDPKNPPRILIFFDANMGRLEISRCMYLDSEAAVKYLGDALKLDAKKPDESYLFFRHHVDSPEANISRDARQWLMMIRHEDIRSRAHRLPPDTIASYLKNEKSWFWVRDLDAMLLGYCGKESHAALLRSLIETDRAENQANGLEGMLIGYALLRPKDGLTLLREMMKESKTARTIRSECLSAVRFFRDKRPDVWTCGQLAESLSLMLSQPDIAADVIQELRQLGAESLLERVLGLHDKKDFDVPDVHLAILDYALTFPKNPKAVQFVEERRAEDPEMVEAEESLKRNK